MKRGSLGTCQPMTLRGQRSTLIPLRSPSSEAHWRKHLDCPHTRAHTKYLLHSLSWRSRTVMLCCVVCLVVVFFFFVFTLLLQHQFIPSTISQFADAQLEFYHFLVILGLSLDLRKKRKLDDKQICENAKIKLDHVSSDSIISILRLNASLIQYFSLSVFCCSTLWLMSLLTFKYLVGEKKIRKEFAFQSRVMTVQ